MKTRALIILTASTVIAGCSTTSFAPPHVNLDTVVGKRTTPLKSCMEASEQSTRKIDENVEGAMALIDNFMVGYRCASRSAAEGRKNFEVPAFLFAATSALGQSFGLVEDATLGIAAAGITATQGNSYFAPQTKADYLNSAIDAITCIQLGSVGLDGFDINGKKEEGGDGTTGKDNTSGEEGTQNDVQPVDVSAIELLDPFSLSVPFQIASNEGVTIAAPESDDDFVANLETLKSQDLSDVDRALLQHLFERFQAAAVNADAKNVVRKEQSESEAQSSVSVSTSAERQFFRLISGALLSVERVLARRLNHAGTAIDASGIVAQVELLSQDEKKAGLEGAEETADGKRLAELNTIISNYELQTIQLPQGNQLSAPQRDVYEKAINDRIVLKVKEIRPKLQKCVLLAKI